MGIGENYAKMMFWSFSRALDMLGARLGWCGKSYIFVVFFSIIPLWKCHSGGVHFVCFPYSSYWHHIVSNGCICATKICILMCGSIDLDISQFENSLFLLIFDVFGYKNSNFDETKNFQKWIFLICCLVRLFIYGKQTKHIKIEKLIPLARA